MSISAAIVVPTRNRADLAIEAVRSLLTISDPRLVRIVVSNNSSDPEHVRPLAEFCERAGDVRLVHIRPPEPLAMAEHWDWAIEQALAESDATHLALHYDRRISKPDLPFLFDLAARWPDVPVTYLLDLVYPAGGRFRVSRMPWTGGAYEISTPHLLKLASRGLLTDLGPRIPALANCVTPRSVFKRIRARFGDICVSATPEAAFAVRFCALDDRYVHFDRALAIHYGVARSNGLAYMRGHRSGTFGDFMALRGERPWLEAAPLPGLNIGQNTFYHEYALLRKVDERRFPPIEMKGYLEALSRGLFWIDDPEHRAEMREVLVKHGWSGEEPAAPAIPPRRPPLRRLRERLDRLRVDHLWTCADDLAMVGLRSEARAVRYALDHPTQASPDGAFLAPLEPVRLQ